MNGILEFQKLDGELLKLQKEISTHPSKRNAQDMKSFVLEGQQKNINLDKEARKLINELEKLKEVQTKGIALVEKFNSQDNDNLDVKELQELEVKMKQALKHLNELDNRLQAHNEKIKSVLQDYENNKKRTLVARQKHAESKASFEEFYKQQEPKLNELKQKMLELQNKLDANDFAKYRTLRQDNIFPVFVPLTNGSRCGGCRMELPSNNLERLKKYGKLECEQCRRVIYFSDKK